jgi:hypothetical protein
VKRLPFAVLIVAIGSVALAEEKDDRSPAQKKLESRFNKEEIAQMRAEAEKKFWDYFDGKVRMPFGKGQFRTRHLYDSPAVRDLLEFRDGYKVFLKALDKLPANAAAWDYYTAATTPEERVVVEKKAVEFHNTHVLLMAMLVPPFDKEVPDKLLPRYADCLEWAQRLGRDFETIRTFLAKRGKRAKETLPKLRTLVKTFHKRRDEARCQQLEEVIKQIEDAKR